MNAPADPDLEALRTEIDLVNERLVQALHERARLCRRIGAHKRASGLPPVDSEREQQMRERLLAVIPADGLPRADLAAVLAITFAVSRRLVEDPAS